MTGLDPAGPAGSQRARLYLEDAERLAGTIPGLPEVDGWKPRRAAVIGAGTMGGGIAMALSGAGVPVTLVDRRSEDVDRGRERLRRTYASSVGRGRLAESEAAARLARVTTSIDMSAVAGADLVIEAVYEELHVKQEVFGLLDRHAAPTALLGTNTSMLDIDAIAAVTRRPENVIGTHFFSPAHVMRLLEVVPGAATSPLTVARLLALGRHLGKVAVRAGNRPGFIGNAMLLDYLRQTLFLVEEGAVPADVDRVLRDFGLAMGPFAMTDMSGHDLALQTRRDAVSSRPQDRRYSDLGLWLVDLGRLGQKSGSGWYRYADGDRTPQRDPVLEELLVEYSARVGVDRRDISDDEILKRCLYSLVNRAAWLLADGVATRPSDVDVVYVTGYGFPAALGGPLHWADSIGLGSILTDIEQFRGADEYGWRPAPLLVDLARSGRTFADLQ